MTIPATPSEVSYAGDDVSTSFPIPFVFDDSGDLKVVDTDADGNASDVTSGFGVTGGAGMSGTLTLAVPLASGHTLTILDNPPLTQDVDYIDNDPFPADSHERALDRATRQIKRLNQQLQRAWRFPDGDPTPDAIIGSVETRKGKFPFFNVTTGGLEYALGIGTTPISQSIIGSLYRPQSPAEIAAGVTPVDYFYDWGDVRRYGGVGDDSTDNATALSDAREQREAGGAPVYVPYGTFRTSQSWVWTVHALCAIRGDDWPFSIIRFTSAVDGLVIKSNHATVVGILLDGHNVGLNGLVEQNSAQGYFERVAAQNWTQDGNRVDTTYASPTGNNNFSRHVKCAFTTNAGYGARAPNVNVDSNALIYEKCNCSGNTLGGLLAKGQTWMIDHGLYEANGGYGISLGEDSDPIVSSSHTVRRPYLESNPSGGVYGSAMSQACLIEFDNFNASSAYVAHPSSENLSVYTDSTSGGYIVFGDASRGIKLHNVNSGGNRLQIEATGTDTDIDLWLFSKGAKPIALNSAGGGPGVVVGATTLNAAALLQLDSTTRGFLPPRMTTTQRDAISSPPDGLLIYNTTTNKFQGRAASAWADLN